MKLTPEDQALLAELDGDLSWIRDRTNQVIHGFKNGLIVWGRGGISKSFSVMDTLRKGNRPYWVHNTRISAPGLRNALRAHSADVHLIEDSENLLDDKTARNMLRSALWGQASDNGVQDRFIMWETNNGNVQIPFNGQIIMTMNRDLDKLPELAALQTRIPIINFDPTNPHIAALMRSVALKSYTYGEHYLSAEACWEVIAELIRQSEEEKALLDMRLITLSYNDRISYDLGILENHWTDCIRQHLKRKTFKGSEQGRRTRKADMDWERELVRRIMDLGRLERMVIWQDETAERYGSPKSEMAYNRRLHSL